MINIIVAATLDGAIGLNGDMLYYIRTDLQRFKALTTGHTVVMGRKTFESLPKGALPHRRNIVITRQPDFKAPGAETAANLDEALGMAKGSEVFIIGGQSIYGMAMPLADRLYLTEINIRRPDADTFIALPDLPPCNEPWQTDERSGMQFRFRDIAL
ncbi:MAG: dihydrofolate reductase [Muribaculaceae bacterium]|nr:dihydrofolate reductase [Muribaculaceae bacterium]